MNDLLNEVLISHGGAERWQSVKSIAAHGGVVGLLPKRFAGNRLAHATFEVQVGKQHTVLHDFPEAGKRAVFDEGTVRIETSHGEKLDARTDARSAFFGLSGVRRNFHWDPLDVAYFAGYASWNYLTSPLLLTRDGVSVTDGGTCHMRGEIWRRLEVRFPRKLHTHCERQTFYVDAEGLIRRHDFVAQPVGSWARAALYCDQHREFDGLIFPTRRRVFPRGLGRQVLFRPTLLALEFQEIEIERYDFPLPRASVRGGRAPPARTTDG
jgi:hypothetical protein